ncbi:MAG TPA: hypothetical protein VJ600_11325, partial [Holophagaceae bacterium]|nr:hypothetical protein [Holophagaceae bacterium]
NVGAFAPQAKIGRRGVIYALAPSFKDLNHLWAGTDDGLIHTTWDGGKSWQDVTPKGLPAWSKIAQLESSHFDERTCYAAVNTLRLDDLRPHIFRTKDGGQSWTEIVAGLPDGTIVNTVREDPKRRGLLFCGTEQSVFVSFDDGGHWQSLRQNLPATSIRDLVVHGDDLVVGTHGRSFWILDGFAPLRELDQARAASTHLFTPQEAIRVRRDLNTDTPLPPEEPVGENPPEGAQIDYWLAAPAKRVTLEILQGDRLVRSYRSDDTPAPVDPKTLNVPAHWIRAPKALAATAGMHRFAWDLRLPDPPALEHEPPISAITEDTPLEPQGPLPLPGDYRVRLTVDGQVREQPLHLRMDPRVKASAEDLRRQFDLAASLAEAMARTAKAGAGAANLNGQLGALLGMVEGADAAPTAPQRAAAEALLKKVEALPK